MNGRDGDGRIPLLAAVASDRIDVTKYLVFNTARTSQ